MKKETSRRKPGPPLRLFLQLSGLELLAAGIVTARIAVVQGFVTTTAVALLFAIAGAACLMIPGRFTRLSALAQKMADVLQSHYGQIVPSALVLTLSVFLFLARPDANAALALSPLLACLWLVGVQFLILFPPISLHPSTELPIRGLRRAGFPLSLQHPAGTGREKWLAFAGLLLAYAITLIPSRLTTPLDGIPWDTPVEFVLVLLILPFAFVAGWKFFAKRAVLWTLGVLLVLKIGVLIFQPGSGLGVRAYSSPEELAAGRWLKSYQTFLAPAYTQVIRLPYGSYRELPIEWINQPGYNTDGFWLALELDAAVRLYEGEKFVLLAQGARQARAEMLEAVGGNAIPAAVVQDLQALNADLYPELPALREFQLHGILIFRNFDQVRVEPLIMRADGSTRSAFSRLWLAPGGPDPSSTGPAFFQSLAGLIGLGLGTIVLSALITGIIALVRTGRLTPVDLFLACSGSLALFAAGLMPKPDMNLLVIVVLAVAACIKLLELAVHPGDLSGRAFLLSVGIAFLLIFLALDIDNLRSAFIFPQSQDGLEYQIFGRNIFVKGDVFLAQTPPRAYKVLFPYFVGMLHTLFGQSASAQFFLNAWFGLLSAMLMLKIMQTVIPTTISFLTAVFFLLVLSLPSIYIYYFRFGLIEPIAILCLLAACYFAIQRRLPGMFAAGMLAVLFRLDYLGAVFAAVILTSGPMTGSMRIAWTQFIDWLRAHWELALTYALSLCALPFLIILGYFMFTPDYILNASDTHQKSLVSLLEGLMRVIVGGNPSELGAKFLENPLDAALIALPLAAGFLIALASLLDRRGLFDKMDLRLALLIPSILPAYIAVRPAAYFPRFSIPLLALDLILIGLFVMAVFRKSNP